MTDVAAEPKKRRRLFSMFNMGRIPLDRWSVGTIIIAALIAMPIVTVFILALSPSDDIWQHLSTTVLPDYIFTTLGLMLGVGIGTLIIGSCIKSNFPVASIPCNDIVCTCLYNCTICILPSIHVRI